jgi:hypothetical protein
MGFPLRASLYMAVDNASNVVIRSPGKRCVRGQEEQLRWAGDSDVGHRVSSAALVVLYRVRVGWQGDVLTDRK